MKTFPLFIFILLSNFCKAQNFNKVYSSTSYLYKNGEWVKGEIKYPENMFVITEDYTIRITNKTKSSFITYGNPEKIITEKDETYTWPGYDKEGNQCLFTIIKTKGCNRMQYTFFLENEAEEYLVDPY
jgi:hypothetical protein